MALALILPPYSNYVNNSSSPFSGNNNKKYGSNLYYSRTCPDRWSRRDHMFTSTQNDDEPPWDDDAPSCVMTAAHTETEWTRLSSDFQNASHPISHTHIHWISYSTGRIPRRYIRRKRRRASGGLRYGLCTGWRTTRSRTGPPPRTRECPTPSPIPRPRTSSGA